MPNKIFSCIFKLYSPTGKATYIMLALLMVFSITASAQRRSVPVSQADPRFTVSVERFFSTLGGSEEYFYFVKNNTNQEFKMVVTVTLDLACVGTKTYMLGVNKIVYLPPNGQFTPDSDWVHILTSGADNFKPCRLKDGDSFTLYKGFSYRITNIVNLTAEKALAEKKKQDELAAKQKLATDKANLEKANAEKQRLAQEATKKQEELKAKTAAEAKTKAAAADKAKLNAAAPVKASATAGTAVSSSTGGSTKTDKTTSSSANEKAEAKAVSDREASAQRRADEEAAAASRKAAEDARKAAEAEELTKKQQEYDSWKSKKQEQQRVQDAESMAASIGVMAIVGGWIYDDMGKVDPMFVLKPEDEKKRKFHMGLDFGYSLSTIPILFASDKTTMVGGKTQNLKMATQTSPFTFNIEAVWKIGLDHQNYGGYAYIAPKLGFSPIFDGFNFSPLNFGGRVYAGAKWVKLYFEYGGGNRQFTNTSNDVEEAGEGNSTNNYTKMEYGIRFTTKHDSDYKRSNISIGVITEKIKPYDIGDYAFFDPESSTLKYEQKSPAIQGFAFQWRKDHAFNWYVNFYPEYIYSGKIDKGSSLSSSFGSTKTGTFIEVGFIRALDFY